MKRIICIGNRYRFCDAAGPMVYDLLARRDLLPEVELVDGGLAGLDLLRFVQGARRVVFVDAVVGFDEADGVFVLNADEAAVCAEAAFDHAAGLAYLLRVLPQVLDGQLPEVLLVGIQGEPNDSAVETAAELSLSLAVEGGARGFLGHVDLSGVRG